VRSVEVHGHAADRAEPGRRTALALVGVATDELERGHVAVTGWGWRANARLDVEIELLASARKPLGTRARVHVHLGTAHVLARLAPTYAIAPGSRGRARLLLETPLVARGGDRFVLRSYSPPTTIGGGVVLDPHAPARPRWAQRKLAGSAAGELLAAWIAEVGLAGVDQRDLPVRLGIDTETVTRVIADVGKAALVSGDLLVSRGAVAIAAEQLGAAVEAYHRDQPLESGEPLETARRSIRGPDGVPVTPQVADLVVDLGVRKRAVELVGNVLRRPGWAPGLDRSAEDRVLALLGARRWEIPTVSELQRELPGAPVQALLVHLVRRGGVEQVDRERYATKDVLDAFRVALEGAVTQLGPATPSQLRDRLGLTRKYLIPLLEWADRRGITRRTGDTRSLARLTAGNGGF
jgi:selenocysteine-specific elongation factor